MASDPYRKISELSAKDCAVVQFEVDVGLGLWSVQLNFRGKDRKHVEAFAIHPRTLDGLITTRISSKELSMLDALLKTCRSTRGVNPRESIYPWRKMRMKVSWIADEIIERKEEFSISNPTHLSDRQLGFMSNLCVRVISELRSRADRTT